MRLQSALLNSEKVQAAQATIFSAYKGIQEHISALSTAATKESRDRLLSTINSLAAEYNNAAEVAFPRFKSFVAGAVSQLQSLSQELRQVLYAIVYISFSFYAYIYPLSDNFNFPQSGSLCL